MSVRGDLLLSICSQIQKCLNMIQGRRGMHFSKTSEILKNLNYPIGRGSGLIGNCSKFFSYFIFDASSRIKHINECWLALKTFLRRHLTWVVYKPKPPSTLHHHDAVVTCVANSSVTSDVGCSTWCVHSGPTNRLVSPLQFLVKKNIGFDELRLLLDSFRIIPEKWQVCKLSINLLTLAGLWTVFGVGGPANHGRFMDTFQI